MKKVMVYAYTAFNLGDDLFIKILCERYPQTMFYLVAPKSYRELFADIDNLKIIPRESFIRRSLNLIMKKLFRKYRFTERLIAKKCDASVYIGGSLFMQQKNWRKQLKHTKALPIKNKPFYLLGANFGPFDDEQFYTVHEQIFQTYTDVCFRDHYSYQLFRHLKNVRQADDIIFQLKVPTLKSDKQSVVISVIKPSIRHDLIHYDEDYYEAITTIAQYFLQQNYHVTFIAFCTEEKDDVAVKQILQRMPKQYSEQINEHIYQHDITSALKTIAEAKFIIATRLHAMLLGWLFNKPVLPIVYNDKMSNILKDCQFEGPLINFSELNELREQTIEQRIERVMVHDITALLTNSEKQFTKLDQFLNKHI